MVSAELVGERFTGVGRRGKYLLFGLDSGRTLVVHLRMTGWFHHRAGGGEEPTHLRAVLRLDDGARSSTPTSAGSAHGASSPRASSMRTCGRGPGRAALPASGRRALSVDLAGRRASVKALLLHQTLVAGVGNIYADEALWQARIHPLPSGWGAHRGRGTPPPCRRGRFAGARHRLAGATISKLPWTRRAARLDAGALQRLRSRRRAVPALRHAHREDPRRQRATHLCPRRPTALRVADRLRAAGLDVDVQEPMDRRDGRGGRGRRRMRARPDREVARVR